MHPITNDSDALVQALVLALTAPDQARLTLATDMADAFASRLSTQQIDACKARALTEWEQA
ncbi:MAG: hypothetical protein O3A25_19225 [Acidobacteria bacterium]|nr:hypothetical protein [Acidobacteriota bacterium]